MDPKKGKKQKKAEKKHAAPEKKESMKTSPKKK
jgi:hypothetical protein